MSEIRVGYSGLISFAIGILTIFTGLLFTLTITRTLTPEEFGSWNFIFGIIGFAIIIDSVINFWAIREIARGKESGKTAILSNGFFSLGGILIFIVIGSITGSEAGVNIELIFFGVGLIPLRILGRTSISINQAWKPHVASYYHLFSEPMKLPLGLFFVYFFDMGVIGIIITFMIVWAVSDIIQIIYARKKLKNEFQMKVLKGWLKRFWVPLYPGIFSFLYKADIIIFPTITGSVVGLAYYSVAVVISGIVSHSQRISSPAYSKLLEGRESRFLQNLLTRFFYFLILLSAISITFSKPGLFALNPIYESAGVVVILLTLKTASYTLFGVFHSFLSGNEKVDMKNNPTWKEFIHSKLFVIPTIRIIQFVIYLSTLVIIVLLLKDSSSEIELVTFWSAIGLAIQIPFTIYLYVLVRKNFEIRIDVKSVTKYIAVGIFVFGTIFILMQHFLVYDENIFEFLPNLIGFMGLAVGGFFGLTYLVDLNTRKLVKAILQEIKKKN